MQRHATWLQIALHSPTQRGATSQRALARVAIILSCGVMACGEPPTTGKLAVLRLSAIPEILAIRKGCGPPSPSSACGEYNTASTRLIVARNGYVGTVALSIAGLPPGVTADFTPVVLPDTATLSVLRLSSATDLEEQAVSFTVGAAASGASTPSITVPLAIVWDAAVFIRPDPLVSDSVRQGQQARAVIRILRRKYTAPVELWASSLVPDKVRLSPNPTTGDSVEMVFDATSLAIGTYFVQVFPSRASVFSIPYFFKVIAGATP